MAGVAISSKIGINPFFVRKIPIFWNWCGISIIKAKCYDFKKLVDRVAEITKLTSEEILDGIRDKKRTDARSILCFWAKEELGITQSQLAEKLNRTQSAISYAVRRGRVLMESNSYSIPGN